MALIMFAEIFSDKIEWYDDISFKKSKKILIHFIQMCDVCEMKKTKNEKKSKREHMEHWPWYVRKY